MTNIAQPEVAKLITNALDTDCFDAPSPHLAMAAKLWLEIADIPEKARASNLVNAWWDQRGGVDPYWDYLGTRDRCAACGMGYKVENLSVCPNCFNLYCPQHKSQCACGHAPLG